MAIESHDIARISVKDDWIKQGLKYGQLSWTDHFNRMGKASPYKKIQNIVIGKAAESAVQEYLRKSGIPYDLEGSTKWYEIDIDDLEIHDHQIDVKSNFIDKNNAYIKRKRIKSELEAKLEWYSKCHALVPTDQINSKNRGKNKVKKLYVFVFVEGTINDSSDKNILHAFWDYRWTKRAEHKNAPHLGQLHISSTSKKNISLTIYGTTAKHEAAIENLIIQDGKATTSNSYHQVFSLFSNSGLPDKEITVKAGDTKLIETIKPMFSFSLDNSVKPVQVISNDWNSVDVQIDHCYIAGWKEKDDFILISKEYPRYTKIFEQYQDTLTSNFACEVKELEPIAQIGNI